MNSPESIGSVSGLAPDFRNIPVSTIPGCTLATKMFGFSAARNSNVFAAASFEVKYADNPGVPTGGKTRAPAVILSIDACVLLAVGRKAVAAMMTTSDMCEKGLDCWRRYIKYFPLFSFLCERQGNQRSSWFVSLCFLFSLTPLSLAAACFFLACHTDSFRPAISILFYTTRSIDLPHLQPHRNFQLPRRCSNLQISSIEPMCSSFLAVPAWAGENPSYRPPSFSASSVRSLGFRLAFSTLFSLRNPLSSTPGIFEKNPFSPLLKEKTQDI